MEYILILEEGPASFKEQEYVLIIFGGEALRWSSRNATSVGSGAEVKITFRAGFIILETEDCYYMQMQDFIAGVRSTTLFNKRSLPGCHCGKFNPSLAEFKS